MIYRKTNANGNTKFIILTAISLIALLTITVNVLKLVFLNKSNSSKYNSLLYAEFLNNSIPVMKDYNYDDDLITEDNISIQGEVLKLLGVDINNPISLMSKEITFFQSAERSGDLVNVGQTDTNKVSLKIEPFDLSDGIEFQENTPPETSNPSGTGTSNSAGSTANIKFNLDPNKPRVLIYHTHTFESYEPNGTQNRDSDKNVCAVGDALKKDLESKYGISVINDETDNVENYPKAYYSSRTVFQNYLNKYKNFDLIIDLHRDAVYSKNSVTTKIAGENVAKIMFVLTKKNPHFDKNAKVVSDLMGISNKLFPGYCRGIYYFNYGSKYFNQDLSNNAILIEVGSQINTIDEAKGSAKYMSRMIAEYLNSQK